MHTSVNDPQSDGMAESFMNAFNREYVDCMNRSNGTVVLAQLPDVFGNFNEVHPLIGRWAINRCACLETSDRVGVWK